MSVALLYLVLELSSVVKPLNACFAGSRANIILYKLFVVIVIPAPEPGPLTYHSLFKEEMIFKLEKEQPSINLASLKILGDVVYVYSPVDTVYLPLSFIMVLASITIS